MKSHSFTSTLVRIGSFAAIVAVVTVAAAAPHAYAADASASVQLQALLKQVAELQAKLQAQSGTTVSASSTGASTGVSTCAVPAVARTLAAGSQGSDVSALQAYLARDASIYPEAQVTGYFGPATARAVGRFQVAHGILPAGTSAANGLGILGPKTRSVLTTASCVGVTVSGQAGVSTNSSATMSSSATDTAVSGSAATNASASTNSIDSLLNQLQKDLKGI